MRHLLPLLTTHVSNMDNPGEYVYECKNFWQPSVCYMFETYHNSHTWAQLGSVEHNALDNTPYVTPRGRPYVYKRPQITLCHQQVLQP
jgi:hypothetical protein